MFTLHPCDELVFATPTTSQTPHHPSLLENNLISFSNTSRARETSFPSPRPKHKDQSRHGRNLRREVERRRRQEMSTLYSSLQSLLPLDRNKGKSSVCDQMEEAANYIKEINKKIQELKTRREEMKKLNNSSSNCGVVIHRKVDGLEIIMSNKSHELKLSRVISEMMERELNVVSCVSTRTKGGFLLKLEIQDRDITSHDVSVLHDRLTRAIKF